MIVKGYLDSCDRTVAKFPDNIPGKDWADLFMKQHDELSTRMCQNIKRARAELEPEIIQSYFDFRNLKESLQDVPAQNILNWDETKRNVCFEEG